jgi:hypothetical protein
MTNRKENRMKKICSSLLLMAGLAACSATSPHTPTPNKLALDIQSIPPQTALSVRAKASLDAPKNAQSIVKMATFVADDNLYDQAGNRLIIPRGAIIVGLYSNDGMECSIDWKAVYASQKDLEAGQGTLTLNQVTSKNKCDPVNGIKVGDRIALTFTSSLDKY